MLIITLARKAQDDKLDVNLLQHFPQWIFMYQLRY